MTLSSLWWFLAAFGAVAAIALLKDPIGRLLAERRYDRAGLAEVDHMDWRDFEHYLAHLFSALGCQAEVTQASGDFGVDVIVTEPGGRRIAVQAKKWKMGNNVGAPEVEQTIGGAVYYKCQAVIVVTTSGYTNAAREIARGTGTQLWGRKELGELIERARTRGSLPQAHVAAAAQMPAPRSLGAAPGPVQPQPPGITVKPSTGPQCPRCGGAMVQRIAAGRRVWLCARFPACNGGQVIG